jgi:hypothetical protein
MFVYMLDMSREAKVCDGRMGVFSVPILIVRSSLHWRSMGGGRVPLSSVLVTLTVCRQGHSSNSRPDEWVGQVYVIFMRPFMERAEGFWFLYFLWSRGWHIFTSINGNQSSPLRPRSYKTQWELNAS